MTDNELLLQSVHDNTVYFVAGVMLVVIYGIYRLVKRAVDIETKAIIIDVDDLNENYVDKDDLPSILFSFWGSDICKNKMKPFFDDDKNMTLIKEWITMLPKTK